MSTTWKAFENEIIDLCSDVRSSKVPVRTKAIDRIDQILNSREQEIFELFDREIEVSWIEFFESVSDGMIKQADRTVEVQNQKSFSTMENKNSFYGTVLLKLVSVANRDKQNIHNKNLLNHFFTVMGSNPMKKYFGETTLKFLNVNILSSKRNLTDIPLIHWSRMLSCCFQLYDRLNGIRPMFLLQQISLIVEIGTNNTHLASDLPQYLPIVEKIMLDLETGNALNEAIKLAYQIGKNLAVDYRLEVCKFIENIFGKVTKSFDTKLDENMKEVIYKLSHLAILLHHPDISLQIDHSYEEAIWNQHLIKLFYRAESEIIFQNNQMRNSLDMKVSPVFIKMLSSLCRVIFWNDSVWNSSAAGTSNNKRVKKCDKIQSVMDLVGTHNKFCWRWFLVLSEIIWNNSMSIDDFQPILNLLVDLQSGLKYTSQIDGFLKCAEVLLKNEEQFFKESQILNEAFCSGLWIKIVETAFRSSTSDQANCKNHHRLLQLLFKYKKFSSTTFIQNLMESYNNNSIKKTNTSLETVTTLLRNFNINSLENSKKVIQEFLDWLYEKSQSVRFRSMVTSPEKIDQQILARLTAMCSLVSRGFGCLDVQKLEVFSEYDLSVDRIRRGILLKSLQSLVICEPNEEILSEKMFLSNELTSIIDDEMLEYIANLMKFEVSSGDSLDEKILRSLTHLEIYLNMLNSLIVFDAVNDEILKRSHFLKKATLTFQEIEESFGKLSETPTSESGIEKILEKLSIIFYSKFNCVLEEWIRTQKLTQLIHWLMENVEVDEVKLTQVHMRDAFFDDETPSRRNVIRHLSLMNLVGISRRDGCASDEAFNSFSQVELTTGDKEDLRTVLILIKEICYHKSKEDRANWIINEFKCLCVTYHGNQTISNEIIDLIPSLIEFMKSYSCHTANLLVIVGSFLKKCEKNSYRPEITEKVIDSFRFLAKAYPMTLEDDRFLKIYLSLGIFVKSPIQSVQMAAVRSLRFIFDKKWTLNKSGGLIDYFNKTIDLRSILEETNDFLDRESNQRCVVVQILTAVLSVNLVLRGKCLFQLSEFIYNSKIPTGVIQPVLEQISTFMKTDHKKLIEDNLMYLISEWLIIGYPLSEFPYFLVSDSLNDFFFEYIDVITICILRHKSNDLEMFAQIMKSTVKDLIQPNLTHCLAYLLPFYAGSSDRSQSEVMDKKIKEYFGSKVGKYLKESPGEIIENLLLNICDEATFKEFFGFDIECDRNEWNLNYKEFLKCLAKLKSYQSINSSSNQITVFCMTEPFHVQYLLISIKTKIQNSSILEQKLQYFFQLCILIILLTEFLQRNEDSNAKQFFVRDICHYLCYTMSHPDKNELNQAAGEFFNKFSSTIGVELFAPHMNLIVSTLVPLCKSEIEIFSDLSLKTLKFFIQEKNQVLMDSIGLLDNFPEDELFDGMRKIYEQAKYKGGRFFTLREEIEHFLQNDNRRVEGLIQLRQHLSTKKDELAEIYKDLKNIRGFSEDCDNSVLHRLINSLLNFVNSVDENKRIEAVKCLGELGPSDLTTMVLKNWSNTDIYREAKTFEDAVENLLIGITKKLISFFVHPDIRVVSKVSDVCLHIMSTKYSEAEFAKTDLKIFKTEKYVLNKLFNTTKKTLELKDFFKEEKYSSHSVWIKKTVCVILTFFDDSRFQAVAALQASFSECLLPHLIKMILALKNTICNRELSDAIQYFFEQHFVEDKSENVFKNKASIKCMLSVVECIRIFNQNFVKDVIQLNYLMIAKAAQFCGAYFTSVLYCELWNLKCLNPTPDDMEMLNEIFRDTYSSLGDMDAVIPFVDPLKSRLKYLQLANKTERVCLELDSLCFNQKNQVDSLKKTLIQSGYTFLAYSFNDKADDPEWECAWRLGDWNVINNEKEESFNPSIEFERQHYNALKCIKIKDEMGCRRSIEIARKSIAKIVGNVSLECAQNIYKNLEMLERVQQIEDVLELQCTKSEIVGTHILEKWRQQDNISFNNFETKEPVLAQRAVLFNICGLIAERIMKRVEPEAFHNNLLKIIQESRKEGLNQIAIRNLAVIDSLELTKELEARKYVEEAQLNWNLGDEVFAKKILIHVVEDPSYSNSISKIVALRLCGEYLMESFTEHIKKVRKVYLNEALNLLKVFAANQDKIETLNMELLGQTFHDFGNQETLSIYHALAKYTDREYIRLNNLVNSPDFVDKKEKYDKNYKIYLEQYKNTEVNEEKRKLSFIIKNLTIDSQERKNAEMERETNLQLCFIYLIRSCTLDPSSDNQKIFRIFSLLLANKDCKEITDAIKLEYEKISSYKFLQVLPQMCAHLSTKSDEFSNIIFSLIERCARDHPHHTLNHILALSNAYKDTIGSASQDNDLRVEGANALIAQLKENRKISKMIIQLEKLCSALIGFANFEIKSNRKKICSSLSDLAGKLNFIQCPTVDLPIKENCDYTDLVTIGSFLDEVMIPGGINAPKRIKVRCSNGLVIPQLLKGKDDMRQDAVMQQVFSIVNMLLRQNKKTSKSRLNIRTYKVVPLSKRSGILEWCQDTIPIGNYVYGTDNAHAKYHPKDWKINDCRKKMTNTKTSEEKYSTYMEICENLQPAFHHFFLEKFFNPSVWFERRLAYINSVATNSMVGYILGLGDRHLQNILIDEKTAEVIHIDFGIAFEQGKILPTPETVPFRLTRDIVAPMGISKTEGVFQKSCEKTLEVLRLNQNAIITILEVLLYDPLYAWTLTNDEANRRQSEDPAALNGINHLMTTTNTQSRNQTAERALIRLEAKLNGKEVGVSTIESQVARLIQEAQSPANLCRLFVGYQPYL